MPKFSASTKQSIREQLVNHAEKLFLEHGLQRTSINVLAESVDIAVGIFYHFFDSKEALYLEILSRHTPRIQERVWHDVHGATTARDAVITYLMTTMNEIDNNPFMQRLITHPEELEMVAKKVPPAFIQQQFAKTAFPLMEYLEQEQKACRITADLKPEVIEASMRAIMAITRHRKEMGNHYEAAKQLMSTALATELTKKE